MGQEHDPNHPAEERAAGRKRLTAWQIIKSVAAAAFGVQTQEARQRDFRHGRPHQFIIAGLAFTVIFILALVLVVRMVLSTAGG